MNLSALQDLLGTSKKKSSSFDSLFGMTPEQVDQAEHYQASQSPELALKSLFNRVTGNQSAAMKSAVARKGLFDAANSKNEFAEDPEKFYTNLLQIAGNKGMYKEAEAARGMLEKVRGESLNNKYKSSLIDQADATTKSKNFKLFGDIQKLPGQLREINAKAATAEQATGLELMKAKSLVGMRAAQAKAATARAMASASEIMLNKTRGRKLDIEINDMLHSASHVLGVDTKGMPAMANLATVIAATQKQDPNNPALPGLQEVFKHGLNEGKTATGVDPKMVAHLSDKMVKAGMPAMEETIGLIKNDINQGNIAGGKLLNMTPVQYRQWFTSSSGRAAVRHAMVLLAAVSKADSGMTVTDKENLRKLVELGMSPGAGAQDFVNAFGELEHRTISLKNTIAGGYSPETVDQFESNKASAAQRYAPPPAPPTGQLSSGMKFKVLP